VSKTRAPWALLAILFVSYGIWRWPGLIAASLSLVIGYFASIRLHPRTACRGCKGTGRHYGFLYSWVFRFHKDCLGTGRKVRWGASRIGTSRVRNEAAAVKQAVQTAERGRWVE